MRTANLSAVQYLDVTSRLIERVCALNMEGNLSARSRDAEAVLIVEGCVSNTAEDSAVKLKTVLDLLNSTKDAANTVEDDNVVSKTVYI